MADADRVARTPEELEAMIRADEMSDSAKLTPKEYARFRSISSPQLVYYHIRNGKIELETCICGRAVIDVKAADEFFKKGEFADGAN